jgi:hypothetical protein
LAVSYRFGDPASGGGTLLVASDDLATLADWLTDSIRLAGSGGEWSAGEPWSGAEDGQVSRAWLHGPSGDPPIRGFRIRCSDGATVGLQLSGARAWRTGLRAGTEGAFSEGVVSEERLI